MNKENTIHNNNVYAYDIKEIIKHISEVESGRKGYYCMGCKAEVEARKGKIRSHYFAHVPSNVKIERQCTFSDETYRHKLAKEILQRIKKIKVPATYKYPPDGIKGKAIKIKDSRTIRANTVRIERQFYENEQGNICYGQNIDFSEGKNKYLLIQPDVSFFDEDDKPILLIEIVATHKVDADKLAKLKRLGIDTVQVIIPKDSPEGIENTFFNTKRTKWLYNYEQEDTEYILLPETDSEGILPIDEFQRKLLKATESFECRRTQIGNLIRGIRKCLETEQFRKVREGFTSEISRTEENTERIRKELERIQGEYKEEIRTQLKGEKKAIKEEGRRIEGEEKEFRQQSEDLERRYYRKRDEIESTQRNYKPDCESEIIKITKHLESLGGGGISFEDRINEIRQKEEELEREIMEEEKRIEEDEKDIRRSFGELEKRRRELEERIEQEFRESEEKIRREFEISRRKINGDIKDRVSQGDARINRRIKKLLESREKCTRIRKEQSRIRTLEQAKKLFESGDYKSWI